MTDGIEAITTATLSLALDAASLRHRAIASNIANINTEGYLPLRVNFESQFEDARRTLRERGSIDAFSIGDVRLQLEPIADAMGQPIKIHLDTEAASLAQNTVQYQALIKGLSRHMSILASAVSDGKK